MAKKRRPEEEEDLEEDLEEDSEEEEEDQDQEPEEEEDYSDLPVVNLANDENDDWLKKADPKAREEELRIHEELEKRYAAEESKKAGSPKRVVRSKGLGK